MSFQTANNPIDAKNPKPPNHHPKASYCQSKAMISINQNFPNQKLGNIHKTIPKKEKDGSKSKTLKYKPTEREIRFIYLSDGKSDPIQTRFGKRSAVVPYQLVIYGNLKKKEGCEVCV